MAIKANKTFETKYYLDSLKNVMIFQGNGKVMKFNILPSYRKRTFGPLPSGYACSGRVQRQPVVCKFLAQKMFANYLHPF
jgi:hypothetical protein